MLSSRLVSKDRHRCVKQCRTGYFGPFKLSGALLVPMHCLYLFRLSTLASSAAWWEWICGVKQLKLFWFKLAVSWYSRLNVPQHLEHEMLSHLVLSLTNPVHALQSSFKIETKALQVGAAWRFPSEAKTWWKQEQSESHCLQWMFREHWHRTYLQR